VAELTILVPTRSRSRHVRRMYDAFKETGAFDEQADLIFLADESDPEISLYQQEINSLPQSLGFSGRVSLAIQYGPWVPMVPKLNGAARGISLTSPYPLGFMGDDHLPRTEGWVGKILKEMENGPAIVSGPDGYRKDDLPTWWVMSASIVYALGRMVPAPVDHMYCDNAVRDLAMQSHCYRWMPGLLVEHLHPFAGKANMDEGYKQVNADEQYGRDMTQYAIWTYRDLRQQAEKVRSLRG
jgi:hypothetical protein